MDAGHGDPHLGRGGVAYLTTAVELAVSEQISKRAAQGTLTLRAPQFDTGLLSRKV